MFVKENPDKKKKNAYAKTKLFIRTMEKLIIDSCTKTTFSFNNKSLLDPVLENIIMTELGNIIVEDLVDKSLIKVYILYFVEILLLEKEKILKLYMNA